MNLVSQEDRVVAVKLSLQRALLGEITSDLVAVGFRLCDQLITIVAFFLPAPTADEVDRISVIGAEVIADMPENFMIEERCLAVDELLGLKRQIVDNVDSGCLVFLRASSV